MADHLPHPQPAEAVPGPNCARKPCKEHNNSFKIRRIGSCAVEWRLLCVGSHFVRQSMAVALLGIQHRNQQLEFHSDRLLGDPHPQNAHHYSTHQAAPPAPQSSRVLHHSQISADCTILWGGPPGPQPTPWSACSSTERAGPGGPARTGASAPRLDAAPVLSGADDRCWSSANRLPLCNQIQRGSHDLRRTMWSAISCRRATRSPNGSSTWWARAHSSSAMRREVSRP